MEFSDKQKIILLSCGIMPDGRMEEPSEKQERILRSVAKLKETILKDRPDMSEDQADKRVDRVLDINLKLGYSFDAPGDYLSDVYQLAKAFQFSIKKEDSEQTQDKIYQVVSLALRDDYSRKAPKKRDIQNAFKYIFHEMKIRDIQPGEANFEALLDALREK